jgi:uncharacterized membrane-anchored protein
MKIGRLPLALIFVVLWATPSRSMRAADSPATENPLASINWTSGPATAQLGDLAQLKVPEGLVFADADGTRRFLEITQNIPSGNELGMLLAEGETGAWFVVFTWADVGHVKDDEKGDLDADALLASMREGQAQSNEERAKRGWEPIEIAGWDREPFYDPETNNLTWATRARSQSGDSVNWSTRLLGRSGYMNVDLILAPDQLATVVPAFAEVVRQFAYKEGQGYAEWRPGEKVAQYGLTALVAGGAVAAAAKSGLLGKFWKLIVFGALAAAGVLKKLWTRMRGEERVEPPAQDTTA